MPATIPSHKGSHPDTYIFHLYCITVLLLNESFSSSLFSSSSLSDQTKHNNINNILPSRPTVFSSMQVANAMIKVLSEPINPYNIYSDCSVPHAQSQRRLANMIALTYKALTMKFDDPQVRE